MAEDNIWLKLLNQSSKRSTTSESTCIVLGNLNAGKVSLFNSLAPQRQSIRPANHLELANYSCYDVEDSSLANPTKLHFWQLDEKAMSARKDFQFASPREPLAFIIALDISAVDEAAETLKRWLTYTLIYIREFSKGIEPDNKRASDSKYLQYLLSARMSKGTALEATEGAAVQHEELSGRARYEFASESFPFPIIVVGYGVDQVDSNNVSQMKSVRELQGRLRALCLEVGAALYFASFEHEASVAQLRRYVLHRLYPENITMELRINDKIHNTFIPSGFDTPDLISLSSGVKVEKDAVSSFVSSAEKRVADWAQELKERQQRAVPTIAPFTTIESEEDWLQSLHGFISKFTAELSVKSSATNLQDVLMAEADADTSTSQKIKSDAAATASTGSGKEGGSGPTTRRSSIINRPVTTDKKDVGDFFKNLMEGGKPAKK